MLHSCFALSQSSILWVLLRRRRDRAAMVQLGPRPRRDRGVDPALVESFPTHEFTKGGAAFRSIIASAGVPVQVALR